MSKGRKVALWIVTVLLTAMFLLAGSTKLLNSDKMGTAFVQYGYAAWFATFIGVCEVLGAIGLLVPRLADPAAAGLAVIMAGAFFTHATHHEFLHSLTPLALLVLLIGVGLARFKENRA